MLSSANQVTVRPALPGDIPGCKQIADSQRDVFGFLTRAVFEEAIQRGTLFVAAEAGGAIAGFVRFRHRVRDRVTCLYDIAVAAPAQRQGVGRALVGALMEQSRREGRTHIQLRCPEGTPANKFYEALGFAYNGTQAGRRRRLVVWQLHLPSDCPAGSPELT